jgi:adenylosuccinate synthase
MNTLIVDMLYGDSGKGRVSEVFGRTANWFVRFNGGPNAGHTVVHNGITHKLHHLPAGAVMGANVALDAGMAIDLKTLEQECQHNKVSFNKVYINEACHLIQPSHREADKDGSGIGSTKKGMAYVYSDRALRKGMRFGDLGGSEFNIYRGLPPYEKFDRVIYESAQGIMLDIDYGNYPYVTSSNVFPSCIHNIEKKVGVMKAYTSRVGDGPPTYPDVPKLREIGQEYGTTTGRPRKCTWLIIEDIDYAMNLCRPDIVVMTKLDILEHPDIKPAVWYFGELKEFNNHATFLDFIIDRYPKLLFVSRSPHGDLEPVYSFKR